MFYSNTADSVQKVTTAYNTIKKEIWKVQFS